MKLEKGVENREAKIFYVLAEQAFARETPNLDNCKSISSGPKHLMFGSPKKREVHEINPRNLVFITNVIGK